MMKNINKIIMIIILFLFIILGSQKVKASGLGFSVQPILPKNQVDSEAGYYDLLLEAGQQQVLTAELSNNTDNPISINISAVSATTNINGIVEYSPNKIKPDSSLIYNFKNYVKAPNNVDIPQNSSKNIQIIVTMPSVKFNGLLAGGITFKENINRDGDESSDSKGVSIKNRFQFVVGLLMQQNQTEVDPILHLKEVEPSQVNYRNVINANFQNSAMSYLKDMVINAKVTAKDKSNILYKIERSNLSMAPNSNFNFPLNLEGKGFKTGTYTYNVEVFGVKTSKGKYVYGKNKDGKPQHYKYHWKFKKDFNIKDKKALALNRKDVIIKGNPDNRYLIYSIIGVILSLFTLLFIIHILFFNKKEMGYKNH